MHKHAELIKQWADGAKIQYKDCKGNWVDCNDPVWSKHTEYREKPTQDPYIFIEEVTLKGYRVDEYGYRTPYQRTETVNAVFMAGDTFNLTMDVYK